MERIERTREDIRSNSYSGDPILSVEGFVSKDVSIFSVYSLKHLLNTLYIWVLSKFKKRMTRELLYRQGRASSDILIAIRYALDEKLKGVVSEGSWSEDHLTFKINGKMFVVYTAFTTDSIILRTSRIKMSPVTKEVLKTDKMEGMDISVTGSKFEEITMSYMGHEVRPDFTTVGEQYAEEFIKNCDKYLD